MNEDLLSLKDYDFSATGQVYSEEKGRRIFRHATIAGLVLHLIALALLGRNGILLALEGLFTLLYAALTYGYHKGKSPKDWILPAVAANIFPFLSLAASHLVMKPLPRNHYFLELGLSLVMVASIQFLNRKRMFKRVIYAVLSGWFILTLLAGAIFLYLDGGRGLPVTRERLDFFIAYFFLTAMLGLSALLSILNFHLWERLRRMERRKNAVQELLTRESKSGLYMIDENMEWVIGNPFFYRILGRDYSPKPQKLGDIMGEILHGNDLESAVRMVEDLKKSKEMPLPLDFRIGAGESWKWIRVDGLYTREDGGSPLFLGSLTDIDHLKKSEEKALSDSSSIKALLMAGQIYPWELDLEQLRFLPLDSSGKGVSPFSQSGAVSFAEHLAAVDGDFRPMVEQAYRGVMEGEDPLLEVDYLFDTEELERKKWLKDVGFPSRRDSDGRPLVISGYTMDIDSDRRQALRIDQAFRASRFIPWQWDRRKGYAELDENYIDLLGVPLDSRTVSRRDFFMRLIHEEDRKKVADFFNRHVSENGGAGRIGLPIQFRIRFHGMEDAIWIEGRITGAQYDTNNSPLFVEGIFRNITREKRRELHLAEEKKEREVADTKNRIFSTVSHELLTPMNGLLGTIGLCRNTELDRSQQELLEKIGLSADLLLGRIEELLDISDLGQGELSLARDIFSPGELFRRTVEDLRDTAQAEDIVLSLEIDGALPSLVKGDRNRIEQILRSLIKNGITFTPRGRVVLSAQSEESFPGSCLLRVSVSDEGIGIPSDKLASIFEPFGQVDNGPTRRQQGIGLSLAIDRQLIELMGGSLEVASTLGRGSVFTMELPLETASSRDRGAAGGTNIYPGSKVLIVDDNPMNRDIAAELLSMRKIKVITAAGGREGLQAISLESPDLVFMDIQMPGMDGYEATRLQREREEVSAHIPIIALTANVMDNDRAMAYGAGMDGFLPKPIDRRKIDIILNKWLKEFRLALEEGKEREEREKPPIPGIAMEETLERFSGEYDMLVELLQDYREDYRGFPERIEGLMGRDDMKGLFARIHALKGVSGSLGISEVYDLSRRMADRYREENRFLPVELESLLDCMARFQSGLDDFLDGRS